MPKQIGNIKVKGLVDGLSYYQTKDGLMVRKNTSVNKERLMKDPAFARTRENLSEFGRAGSQGRLLRLAFRNAIREAKDSKVVSRLHKLLMQIIKSDPVMARGKRTAENGNLGLLQGFEFNVNGKLSVTAFFPYTTTFDRVTGLLELAIPDFVPLESIQAPTGTTHVKLLVNSAELDFMQNTFYSKFDKSSWIPWDGVQLPALTFGLQHQVNSTLPVAVVLGLAFGQEVNSEIYPLRSGNYNAAMVTDVLTI